MCGPRLRPGAHPIERAAEPTDPSARRLVRAKAEPGPQRDSRNRPPRRPLALPKDPRFITFDCYGTLIDWETGAFDAYQKEAQRDGFTVDRNVAVPLFLEIQHEIERGSYELYAEVLRRTAVRAAKEMS